MSKKTTGLEIKKSKKVTCSCGRITDSPDGVCDKCRSESKARIFKLKKSINIPEDKVQKYGEYLWNLKEENGEFLTKDLVLQKAKSKSSPIHDFFEWDDSEAAHKYRLEQARWLIRHIEIIVKQDGEEVQIKAFHYVIKTEENDENGDEDKDQVGGFVTIEDLKTNENWLQQVLDNALQEIIGWKKRYSEYRKLKEFQLTKPLFREIEKIEKEVIKV